MSERSLFLQALEVTDPVERAKLLDHDCAGDPGLRERVEMLLAAHAAAGGILDQPAVASPPTDLFRPVTEGPGTVIGPYKLLQQIGEGGFGLVYMAEQQRPVRRKVALKIIKPGMDTREVIARFESERQALALMDHPNIARVLDGGTTESGRPYFVMELVKGVPLTQFCDDNKLDTRQRLALFSSVCKAIQHAHHKGVIHRDIKPTNVMVTLHDGQPVPKVIDFGVSKAISQQLTDKTMFTAYGQMIGTPAYMSPEQAEMSGLDIDTRSDVYSLGVLLYELLTGSTPLEANSLRGKAYAELQRMIREDEPPRPSLRVSTQGAATAQIAAQRGTGPRELGAILRGELDWIVMKALEKNRDRRYESANNFAADVERYLRHEAVEACPPSAVYRIRKFIRRNRVACTTGALIAASLLGGILISVMAARDALYQRRLAEESLQVAFADRQRAEQAQTNTVVALATAERERDRAEKAKSEESKQLQLAQEQRAAAAAAQQSAVQAEQSAIQERNNALAAREDLRQTLYAAELNLVQVAWDSKQFRGVAQLLDQQRPAAGQSDLRGFEWHYWQRRLQHGRLREVEIPKLATRDFFRSGAIAFSRGGTRLAAVVDDPSDSSPRQRFGLLAIFDCTTGRELIAPLEAFPDWRGSGGRRLLSMSNDGTRLALALAANPVTLRANEQPLDRISIRDGGTGREISSLESPGSISDIGLTPDGSRLAVAYFEGPETHASRTYGVKVWDTSTGELIQTLPMLLGGSPILWSPDGTRLFRESRVGELDSGIRKNVFHVVDVASGEELWERQFELTNPVLRPWTWSPDGKLLAIAEPRGVATKPSVQLWDSDTGTTLAILDREAESPISDTTIAFSPDAQLLAVVSEANEIYVWEVPQLPQVALAANASPHRIAAANLTLPTSGEEIRGLAFSADSRELHSVAATSIEAWDATVRADAGLGPDPSTGLFSGSGSRSVAISADTTKVAFSAGGSFQDFSIWDVARDQELCRLKTQRTTSTGFRPVFSPDGRRIAVVLNRSTPQDESQIAIDESRIAIYDTQTGAALNAIQVKSEMANSVYFGQPLFRPDGGQIAAVVYSSLRGAKPDRSRLMAWNAANQEPVFSVDISGQVNGYLLGYSPDGVSLVVGHYDFFDKKGGPVEFYDASTGQLQRTIPVPSTLRALLIDFPGQSILAVGPPDVVLGQRATAFGRSDLVLLDLATGQERLRLRGHDGFDEFAISPDGSRLALGKAARSLRGESEVTLWSLQSGRRVLTRKRQGLVEALAFSPDGNRLLAVFPNFTSIASKPIQIWDATPLPDEPVVK